MYRRRVLIGTVLSLLPAIAYPAASQLHNRKTAPTNATTDLSQVSWPARGQAALVLGTAKPMASPHQQAVPIASLAKVMTAYLTLKHYPLNGTQDGFAITITPADVETEARDASQDQSVVAVQAGERLTERELLEGLLIPSGNNIAKMLAVRVGGSETRFLAEMNAEAHILGMNQTIYTDPSGFDPATVSTAADQLLVFQRAMRSPVFLQIISMARVTLPVAGTLNNTNPLIAEGYAGKTGSDFDAGACLAFITSVTAGGSQKNVVGVVMGQWETDNTSVILAAAGEAAKQLVGSIVRLAPR